MSECARVNQADPVAGKDAAAAKAPLAPPVGGPLQLDSDDAFTRREFTAESVGWLLLGLLLVAGMLGALGSGPLSSARAVSSSGRMTLDYQRITHQEADDHIVVEIVGGTDQGTITVQVGGDWLDDLDLRQVTPQPSEERATPEGVDLTIAVSAGGPVRIVLSFRTRALGPTQGVLRAGGEEIRFTQFVLP